MVEGVVFATSSPLHIYSGSILTVTFSNAYTNRGDTPLYAPSIRTFVSSVAQSGFPMRNTAHAYALANAQSLTIPQAYLTLGCE